MNFKINAVVIFYNPSKEHLHNIFTYIDEVSKVYILDNSPKPIDEGIFNEYPKISYLHNRGNLGISKCLNLAASMAIQDNCQWLLTMDQDSVAPKNFISNLFAGIENTPNIGIISPRHYNANYKIESLEPKIEKLLVTMASGNLLNLKVFAEVGPFDEKLFIDYVDIDYCLRIAKRGYSVIRKNTVSLVHCEGNLKSRKYLMFTVRPYDHNPLRWYYKSRNRLYLYQKHRNDFVVFLREERKRYFKDLLKILLFEKNKLSKFKFAFRGVLDFRKNVMGEYR